MASSLEMVDWWNTVRSVASDHGVPVENVRVEVDPSVRKRCVRRGGGATVVVLPAISGLCTRDLVESLLSGFCAASGVSPRLRSQICSGVWSQARVAV